MANIKVFISSVQREFAGERQLLCRYIREDALLGRFFAPFNFEELPAIDLTAQQAYLTEAAQCDIYLSLFGEQYGYEDASGISPTEREYDTATTHHRHRLIFIKQTSSRHAKEKALVAKAEQDVVRKSFSNYEELRSAVYASVVRYLEEKEYLRLLPFDTTLNRQATMDDIDPEKVRFFVNLAKAKRSFPIPYLPENIPQILTHLNLISESGVLTNAALLLFAKDPQRFFITSEVKCAVFPTNVMTKPILSYQVFHGSVFEMIDHAVGFVMSHIDARVAPRYTSAATEVNYEIPIEAVTEAIVNAVTHRDYASNGSVQVMLFRDRLEVWNPGSLPFGLSPAKLKQLHSSLPPNPVLANPIYLAGYIERMGTETTDLVSACEKAGLKSPEFIQDEDFRVVIYRKNVTQNVTQNKGVKKAPRILKVLQLMFANTHISAEEMAVKLKVTERTIRRDIDKLREQYDIEWIGSSKNGYWKIVPKKD